MLKFDLQTDLTWLNKVSFKLDRFKRASASSNVFVCRCPICGDSDKDKKKTRLYFYEKKFQMNVYCHNCGYSHAFYNFMKDAFPNDFDEYKKEQLLNRLDIDSKRFNKPTRLSTPPESKTSQKRCKSVLNGVVDLTDLDDNHPAVTYLKQRGFNTQQLERLLWSEDFYVTASGLSPDPLSSKFPSDGRIVIPFYDTEGNVEMVQGRAVGKSSLRYISIKSHPDVDKIFGKYELDRSKTSYCVEGPLDSLFVDNCVATCDSNLLRSNADVLVFDNQPRNKEIVDLMTQAIEQNRSVVVWPTSPNTKQDINDMVMQGMQNKQLMKIIKDNTLSGMKAKLALMKWKKV